MTKELKEFNGIKVGDTVYVSDLYNTQGATYILDGSTYVQDPEKIGKGTVIAMFDWDSDLSGTPYFKVGNTDLVISGKRFEEEDVIPTIYYEEEDNK